MEMIVDVAQDYPFTAVPNSVLRDETRLSWKAKGLYSFLLSCPKGWHLRETDLMRRGTEGRDAVRNAIKELETAGYVVREQEKAAGRFGGVVLKVYLVPRVGDTLFPVQSMTEKPATKKPATEKPATAGPPPELP